MDKKSLKTMERKIKNLERELKLEKKGELQNLESEREKEELLEKIAMLKERISEKVSVKSRIGIRSEVKVVEKKGKRENSSSGDKEKYEEKQ